MKISILLFYFGLNLCLKYLVFLSLMVGYFLFYIIKELEFFIG